MSIQDCTDAYLEIGREVFGRGKSGLIPRLGAKLVNLASVMTAIS